MHLVWRGGWRWERRGSAVVCRARSKTRSWFSQDFGDCKIARPALNYLNHAFNPTKPPYLYFFADFWVMKKVSNVIKKTYITQSWFCGSFGCFRCSERPEAIADTIERIVCTHSSEFRLSHTLVPCSNTMRNSWARDFAPIQSLQLYSSHHNKHMVCCVFNRCSVPCSRVYSTLCVEDARLGWSRALPYDVVPKT